LGSLIFAIALQDTCRALQDSWPSHLVALVGLIARLRGTTLQDIIAEELSEAMVTGHAMGRQLGAETFAGVLHPPAASM
jgi:hypothetical protein